MKATTLRILAGVTTSLILTGSVQAGFTGISTVSKPNQFGLLVCNVYAEFDRPGEDLMQAGAGTANAPLLIEVIGGTFYNHPLGTNRAPSTSDVAAFRSLAFDSFVTIGVKARGPNGQPIDEMVFGGGFPLVSGRSISTTQAGYAVVPSAAQADPFHPDYIAGDGRVLIGQFSTLDGVAIQGTMLVQYVSNNIVGQTFVSFFHVPEPGTLWLLGAMALARRRR